MKKLLVVGLTPTVQRTLCFETFTVGNVNRARETLVTASGKGVNVARVATLLGERVELVQILGGAGYTTDFPVEQFYREARIHPIHEGTTGIHGLDLLGRKVTMHGGKGIQLLVAEMQKAIADTTTYPELTYLASQLGEAISRLTKVTTYLLGLAADPAIFLADATLYLEFFGIVTLAWQWLRQATVAQAALHTAQGDDQAFYQGKLMTARYFYEYELVKTLSLTQRLQSADHVTLEMHSDWF
ncbi:MAG: hypothetical protein EOO39_00985 [Cytophagaceae bacterium]|nr:MAG: hypothetical protein EOO39_00985 [Cytophagaceae bacterium]